MKRWHVTLGLFGLVVTAAVLAPRVRRHVPANPLPVTARSPVDVQPASGHLALDVGVDRPIIAGGQLSERYVVVTLTAPPAATPDEPVDLAIVLDTSGSMNADDAMEHAKAAAREVVGSLDADDRLTVVTFDESAATVIPYGPIDRESSILAISRIYEGGPTNLYAGLEQARLELVRGNEGHQRRMIVLSDGNPTAGVRDEATIERFAASLQADGISVSTVGLGAGYNERLLARIADEGGGKWRHVSAADGLEDAIVSEFRGTTQVVADATHVRIRLAEGVDPIAVLGWDAVTESDGWTVNVGQIRAGETRKVVARVAVRKRAAADLDYDARIADVQASWLDRIDDASGAAGAGAIVTVTAADRGIPEGDPAMVALANEARAAEMMGRAAEEYAAGRLAESRGLTRSALDLVPPARQHDVWDRIHGLESANPEWRDRQEFLKQARELARDLGR